MNKHVKQVEHVNEPKETWLNFWTSVSSLWFYAINSVGQLSKFISSLPADQMAKIQLFKTGVLWSTMGQVIFAQMGMMLPISLAILPSCSCKTMMFIITPWCFHLSRREGHMTSFYLFVCFLPPPPQMQHRKDSESVYLVNQFNKYSHSSVQETLGREHNKEFN